MGTRMAPSYANCFMDVLETNFLDTQQLKPFTWWHFIDDIFMVWTHGEPTLHSFIQKLNTYHHTIKFTFEFSPEQITFLDTRVYIKENTINTDQPTNTYPCSSTSLPAPCHS